MTRKGAFVAAAVVVVFNLGVLGHVALNRSGEPEASLQLTERELSLPPREAENTAMALRLEWVDPEIVRPGPGWFGRQKLEEIGFDCSPAPTDENRLHYSGMLPRATYAVLEFEGEAWRRYLADPQFDARSDGRYVDPRRAEREPARRASGSHLVLVDVGNDPAALRARHPDRRRQLVVPATAVVVFVHERGQSPHLEGRVTAVLPSHANVTRDHRRLLETLQAQRRRGADREGRAGEAPGEPRYRATVTWGRSLEPWLADVQAIPPPSAGGGR